MAELKEGTTIAGYTAIHSGLKEIRLTGNISLEHLSGTSRINAQGNLVITANGTTHINGHTNMGSITSVGDIWWNNGTDSLNGLKSSINTGKDQLAAAITGRGGSASGTETLLSLATKIANIKTGYEVGDVVPLNKMESHYEIQTTKILYPLSAMYLGSAPLLSSLFADENKMYTLSNGSGWFDFDPDNYRSIVELVTVDFNNPANSNVRRFTKENLPFLNAGANQMSMQMGSFSFKDYSYIVAYIPVSSTTYSNYIVKFPHNGGTPSIEFSMNSANYDPTRFGYRTYHDLQFPSSLKIYLTGKIDMIIPLYSSGNCWMHKVDGTGYARSFTYNNGIMYGRVAPLDLTEWFLQVNTSSVGNWDRMVATATASFFGLRNGNNIASYTTSAYIWYKYYSDDDYLFVTYNSFVSVESLGSGRYRYTRQTINKMNATTLATESITTHWTIELPVKGYTGVRRSDTEICFIGYRSNNATDMYLLDLTTGAHKIIATNIGADLLGNPHSEPTLLGFYAYNENEIGETNLRSLISDFNLSDSLHKYNLNKGHAGWKIIN